MRGSSAPARATCRCARRAEPPKSSTISTASIDLVLIDAPCTGTGSWRRNPDAKWRLRPGALEQRRKDQVAALDRAVPLVKPGGRIAYVTCSVLDEENGAQIRDFLGRHPDFSVEKPDEVAQALGERAYLFLQGGAAVGRRLLMTPRRTGTDGFFVSLLRTSQGVMQERGCCGRLSPESCFRTRHGAHTPPRQASHRRFRLAGHAAHRAAGARGGRLFRDRAVPESRRSLQGDEAEGRDPLRRPGLRARKGRAARAAGDLSRPACRCSASATASRRWRSSSAARSRAGITANSAAPR